MKQYLELVRDVYENGVNKSDRTGTGTRSVFGRQLRFNLQEEFPIVKAKFTAFRLVAVELLWLLSGDTNIQYLLDNNCHIWDEWASKSGDLGPVYGEQWRSWPKYTITNPGSHPIDHMDGSETLVDAKILVQHIDQIKELVNKLKTNPNDRRMIVSAWNVSELDKMALPPCHMTFQVYTSPISRKRRAEIMIERSGGISQTYFEEGEEITFADDFDQIMDEQGIPRSALSCQLYQRSADLFLGNPMNIASYSLLTHMLAQVCGYDVGEFIWTTGDTHIYHNHFEQVEEMLSRPMITEKAKLWLNPEIKDIDRFKLEDIRLDNYIHHKPIKAPVAV